MQETVSVDDEIKKGIYSVNLPALLIFMIGVIASFAMAFLFFRPYDMIAGLIISYLRATVYHSIMAAKRRIWAFDRVPQIILNNDGIRTADIPFYKWNGITNEKTIREGTGKYAMYYLYYDHPKGSNKFHLNDLEMNFIGLQRLLRLYRDRNDQLKF